MNDNNGMRCKELKDDQRNEEEYVCECGILSLYFYIFFSDVIILGVIGLGLHC